ncbi:MAG: UDP-N-acetylmuramoyl-L-alanine--D-glutamate ligase [Lachnospiraceae bacterium]|nr:UDP-N-acetylmuramoyl-L-alanine--D-glutamate ligase [Lachnospiraceae bacterium]
MFLRRTMDMYEKFDKKKILIWGFGREGQSTKRFLEAHCSPAAVDVYEGGREGINEDDWDYIVKSPGIVMDDDDPRFTSQTQIFLETYRKNTVGITGTKGKSTTSALLHHVLESAGRKTVLLGNIGEPCLDHFGAIDDDTIVVFEMSCHQLAHVTVSPHVAVFLNLFEEHLDYYKTFDRYFAAKANITKYQTEGDILYAGENVPEITTDANIVRICAADAPSYNLKILGHHNDLNAHFVHEIASNVFGIDDKTIRDALSSFTGLAHRLQYVGTLGGIDYYDDSISTIPSAAIEAMAAVPNVGTILIGGMDRGIDYSVLIDHINSNTDINYIFSYDSGKRIYESVNKTGNCIYKETLTEAVECAKSITPPGSAIVLSPASASYGYFKNFEERGDVFRKLCGFDDPE